MANPRKCKTCKEPAAYLIDGVPYCMIHTKPFVPSLTREYKRLFTDRPWLDARKKKKAR